MLEIEVKKLEVSSELLKKIDMIKNLYSDAGIHYITEETTKEREKDLYLEEKDYNI